MVRPEPAPVVAQVLAAVGLARSEPARAELAAEVRLAERTPAAEVALADQAPAADLDLVAGRVEQVELEEPVAAPDLAQGLVLQAERRMPQRLAVNASAPSQQNRRLPESG